MEEIQNQENSQLNQEGSAHQQSLVKDSFSTIERLEDEMTEIEKEFKNLDSQDNEND